MGKHKQLPPRSQVCRDGEGQWTEWEASGPAEIRALSLELRNEILVKIIF